MRISAQNSPYAPAHGGGHGPNTCDLTSSLSFLTFVVSGGTPKYLSV